jgi:hypothetical protein
MPSSRPAALPQADPHHSTSAVPRLTQRLRRRVAALSLVGAMMVALPLVQVLRFQAEQIDLLVHHQSALNPIARAVQVQRGVMAHQDLARQVLQGLTAAEPDRLVKQDELSQGSATLVRELHDGHHMAARQEALALQEDFAQLAPKIAAHQISALASDQSHRLLVEQVLQVMDLVQDAQAERTAALEPALALALAPTRQLPRQLWRAAQNQGLAHPTQADLGQQWQALDKAQALAASAVNKALVDAQRQRTRTLAMMGALAMLALGLLLQLWRSVVAPRGQHDGVAGTAPGFVDSLAAPARQGPASEKPQWLGAMRRNRRAQDKAEHGGLARSDSPPASATPAKPSRQD